MEESKIDWKKYGFKKFDKAGYCFEQDVNPDTNETQFPFLLDEETDGTLTVWNAMDAEYIVSKGQIPATNQSLALLLKAFAVKRENKD